MFSDVLREILFLEPPQIYRFYAFVRFLYVDSQCGFTFGKIDFDLPEFPAVLSYNTKFYNST